MRCNAVQTEYPSNPLIPLDIVQWTLCSCALHSFLNIPPMRCNAVQTAHWYCREIVIITKKMRINQLLIQYPIFNDVYWNCIILDSPEFHWYLRHDHRGLKPAITEVKWFHIVICIFLHWWLTRLINEIGLSLKKKSRHVWKPPKDACWFQLITFSIFSSTALVWLCMNKCLYNNLHLQQLVDLQPLPYNAAHRREFKAGPWESRWKY